MTIMKNTLCTICGIDSMTSSFEVMFKIEFLLMNNNLDLNKTQTEELELTDLSARK